MTVANTIYVDYFMIMPIRMRDDSYTSTKDLTNNFIGLIGLICLLSAFILWSTKSGGLIILGFLFIIIYMFCGITYLEN